MTQLFADNCRALLTASIGAADTSLTVETAKADRYPVGTTTSWGTVLNWFKAVLIDSSGNREVIKVGVRALGSGVFSNILRAQDGTTALAFTAGLTSVTMPIMALDVQNALAGSFAALASASTLDVVGKMKQGAVEGRFTPVGGIIMWSGSLASIPAGWGLCDGTAGKPDLRDRFIIGAGGAAAVGATGGSRDAALVSHSHGVNITSAGQSAGHSHAGTTDAEGTHSHPMFGGNVGRILLPGVGGGGTYGPGTASTGDFTNTGAGSAHGHGFTTGGNSVDHSHLVSGNTAAQGVSATDANLPPYFVMAFIICLAA